MMTNVQISGRVTGVCTNLLQSRQAGWRAGLHAYTRIRTRTRICICTNTNIPQHSGDCGDLSKLIYRSVLCPDALLFKCHVPSLASFLWASPGNIEGHIWWLCFKYTNIFTNSHRYMFRFPPTPPHPRTLFPCVLSFVPTPVFSWSL